MHRMTVLSYAHGAADVPLLGETIGENLRRTVERFPDREALVVRHQNFRATYRQFWDATTRVARGLLAHGVKAGDRIGIWSPNRFEWVVVQYATARIGAILVNINPSYKSSDLQYVLNQAGVSVLFLAQRFRQTDYVALLEQVRPHCPELRQSFILDVDWESMQRFGDSVPMSVLIERESRLQFDDAI